MQVRKVVVITPRNGALLRTGRINHRELKAQIHEGATTERLISHAISDPSVKAGVEGAATMAGATGVGATGTGVVVVPGDVEGVEKGRPIISLSHAFDGASGY